MINLTDENFDKEIQNTKKIVLVDFWADWCLPCKTFSPILQRIAKELEKEIVFAKVNIDEAPLAATKFNVEEIPTIFVFKNGKLIDKSIGLKTEIIIKQWLKTILEEYTKKDIEKTIKQYEKYAEENGFKLNPEKNVVNGIAKGLLANEKRYGERYCPCRRVKGNKEEDKNKICPCQWHKKEIEKQGHCLCQLFYKNT